MCCSHSYMNRATSISFRFSMSATRGSLRMFVKPYETHNFFFVFLFQRFFFSVSSVIYTEKSEWDSPRVDGEVRARWSERRAMEYYTFCELYGSGHECASEEALLYDLQTLMNLDVKGKKNSTYTTRCYNIFQLVIDIWWNFQHLIVRRRNILVCLVISRSGIVLRLLMRAHRVAGVRQKFTQKFAEIFKLRLSSSTRNIINIQWALLMTFHFFFFFLLAYASLLRLYFATYTHPMLTFILFFFFSSSKKYKTLFLTLRLFFLVTRELASDTLIFA